MLVWMDKPSVKVLKGAQVGATKFYCGRKHKYGMTLQAICNHKRQFMDIDIRNPGSTSDYLCFTTSEIIWKLETPGFLADGLCLFGDNAYINTPFMASPFKAVSGGPKDGYNFFHSQLRINIECAFGMLVHRWAVLRKPIPVNIEINKLSSLVRCLCRLHNYCINERDLIFSEVAERDAAIIGLEGGISFPSVSTPNISNPALVDNRLDDLLDGGEHFEDFLAAERRQHQRMNIEKELPRENILKFLVETRKVNSRPMKKGSTTTNHV